MKMCPNDASGIFWALGEPFFLSINYFTLLIYHRWHELLFYIQ